MFRPVPYPVYVVAVLLAFFLGYSPVARANRSPVLYGSTYERSVAAREFGEHMQRELFRVRMSARIFFGSFAFQREPELVKRPPVLKAPPAAEPWISYAP